MTKLSVIIPVLNEQNTILQILKKVNQQKKIIDLEIIVVDDHSNDETIQILESNKNLYDKLIKNSQQLGKGGAFIEGLGQANGDIILIQDADLEYNPNDYQKLIDPFLENKADVVYGSRFIGAGPKKIMYYSHEIANKIITIFCNLLTNRNFSDVETGYKVFKTSILKQINLSRKDFGIEIELTMKLASKNLQFFEVGISYNGRTYSEGKKIKIKDAVIAIWLIFYFYFQNFFIK